VDKQDQDINTRVAIECLGYQFSTPPGMYSNHWWRKLPDGRVDVCFDALPNYSEYMQYAWLVVEELTNRSSVRFALQIHRGITWIGDKEPITETIKWSAGFNDPVSMHSAVIESDTAPLAICKASLDICAAMKG
jgi:hypothetical protein